MVKKRDGKPIYPVNLRRWKKRQVSPQLGNLDNTLDPLEEALDELDAAMLKKLSARVKGKTAEAEEARP